MIIQRVLQAGLPELRAWCLCTALVIYAFFGLPTPSHFGWPELAVAALLVCAVGVGGALEALKVDLRAPLWRSAGQGLLLYGICAGSLSGLAYGHEAGLMLRDLIPFFFMMMPVLLYGLYGAVPQTFKYVLAGVCVIGVVFALRALENVGVSVVAFFLRADAGEPAYLENMPTVLFTALFLFGAGFKTLITEFSVRAALRFVAMSAVAGFILLPLALTAQRASLGYAVLYAGLVLGYGLYKAPYRTMPVIIALAAACLPFASMLGGLAGTLAEKTSLVGANARFEEFSAVWGEISRHPSTVLFGTGWGGTFESPAVAEIRVNFTHSLLSSALLKMGLAGFVLVALYLAGLALAGLELLKARPFLALALAGPIAIDVFLYASFKSLDFGLMLLMIPACLSAAHLNGNSGGVKVANPPGNVYSG